MIGQVSPHPEWRIIVERLAHVAYGTEITHAQIAADTGLAYPSHKYYGHVSRATKKLRREHDRVLVNVASTGYRVIQPGECEGEARRQVIMANRKIRRGRETLQAAPDELLTEEKRQRKANALAKFGALQGISAKALRETRPAELPPRAEVPKMFQALAPSESESASAPA